MERCPVCRARLKEEDCCPRCSADLSLPRKIERQAETLEREAVVWIARGDSPRAEQALSRVLGLKSDPMTRALQGFVKCKR